MFLPSFSLWEMEANEGKKLKSPKVLTLGRERRKAEGEEASW